VARKLVGLRLATSAMAAVRAPVRAERGEIGRVTSAAWSPRLRCTVALAYVHRDYIAPGAAVTVDCDEGSVGATVCAFPMTPP
jgi:glycine cleavage system aminomethyltransferase T